MKLCEDKEYMKRIAEEVFKARGIWLEPAPDCTFHVVVATKEALDVPDSWRPFSDEDDATISDLMHRLPEHHDELRAAAPNWRRPQAAFHFIGVHPEDLQDVSGLSDREMEFSIVWDVVCEADVATRSEYAELLLLVADPKGARQYFIAAKGLSKEQEERIGNRMFRSSWCKSCKEKKEFIKAFERVWMAAGMLLTLVKKGDVGRRFVEKSP